MKRIFLLAALLVSAHSLRSTDVFNYPGRYVYGSDVVYLPTADNEPAISIETSNIILDLGGRTVILNPSTTNTGTIGISVAPNLSNIIITNGTIIGLNGPGIVINDGCSQVYIDKMAIRACAQTAVLADGTTTGITNLNMSNNSFVFTQSTTTAYGVHLMGCDNIGISTCQFISNGTPATTTAYAARLESCSGALITNTNFVQTTANTTAAGLSLNNCAGCLVQNCIFFNNRSTLAAGAAYGIMLDGGTSSENRFFNCTLTSNGNSLGEGAALYSAQGTNNIIESCSLEFSNGSTVSAGIIFDGESLSRIQNSTLTGNNATAGDGYGILLRNTNTNCYIADNLITNNVGTAGSFGIVDEDAVSTSCVIQNTSFNNATSYSITYPAGITLPVVDGSVVSSSPGLPSNDVWNNISIAS